MSKVAYMFGGGTMMGFVVWGLIATEALGMLTLFLLVPGAPLGYVSNIVLGGNCFTLDFTFNNVVRSCPMGTMEYDGIYRALVVLTWFAIGALLGLLVHKRKSYRKIDL